MRYLYDILKENRRYLVFFYAISLLVYGTWIFTNTPFKDDFPRLIGPDPRNWIPLNWQHTGLTGATALYHIVSANFNKIVFLGPLPQLIGLFFYSVLAVLTVCRFSAISYRSMVLALPITVFPYVFFAFGYKFDGMGFSLGLLLSSLPLLYPFKNRRQKNIATIALVTAALNFYQQSISGYFVLALFVFIVETAKGRPLKETGLALAHHLLLALAGIVVYYIMFKLYILFGWVELSGWGKSRSDITLNPLHIARNIYAYLKTHYIKWRPTALGPLMLAASSLFAAKAVGLAFKNQKKNHRAGALIALGAAIGLLFIAPGAIVLLNRSVVFSFRYFYAFGLLFALLLLFIMPQKIKTKRQKAVLAFSLYLVLVFASRNFYESSAVLSNIQQAEEIHGLVHSDLSYLQDRYPIASHRYSQNGTLLTFNPEGQGWQYQAAGNGYSYFFSIYYSPISFEMNDYEASKLAGLPILKENLFYTIYLDGQTAVIDFKHGKQPVP